MVHDEHGPQTRVPVWQRRGHPAACEVRRDGLQFEQVGDQQQHTLGRSQVFFDGWPECLGGARRAQLEARVGSEAGHQVAMIEVTISERGEVEKARLISAPNSIHGAMLLSVIKAWQFTPATKDGQAVRYRQVMPLIAAR